MRRALALACVIAGGCANGGPLRGVDAATPDAGAHDAFAPPDTTQPIDAAPPVDAFVANDAASGDDAFAAVDAFAPHDAPSGTDAGNDCLNHGGTCVALAPGTCPAPNVEGTYSCGPGLGVTCCMAPATSTMPVCMMTGTAQEGWYWPDGTLICTIACAGLTATCERIGTTSQGWYTTSGHGCPPHTDEIAHDGTCT